MNVITDENSSDLNIFITIPKYITGDKILNTKI